MDVSGWSHVGDPLSATWRPSVQRDREFGSQARYVQLDEPVAAFRLPALTVFAQEHSDSIVDKVEGSDKPLRNEAFCALITGSRARETAAAWQYSVFGVVMNVWHVISVLLPRVLGDILRWSNGGVWSSSLWVRR